MTLSGGCANKNLIRVGGGSVRSLVVLVFMAIAAYMTLKGLFGQWRASLLDPVALDLADYGWKDQSLATARGAADRHGPRSSARAPRLAVLVLALLVFVFKDKRFRANRLQVLRRRGHRRAGRRRLVRVAATSAMARTRRRWSSGTSPPTRARSSR